MIVYVEYVLLDNGILDMLLAYLCRLILRQKPTRWRIILSAAVGTCLVFPFLFITPVWARLLYKIAVLAAVCIPLSDSAKSLRKNMVVYTVLSCVFGGVFYLLSDTSFTLQPGVVSTTGGVVGLTAGGIIIALYLIRQIRGLIKEGYHKRHHVKVQLVNGKQFAFVNGFFDSGNTAVGTNGKGIVFLSPKLQPVIGETPCCDQVDIRTVGGRSVLQLHKLDCVKIYCNGVVNTINQVNIAYSQENLTGCDALLPYNL